LELLRGSEMRVKKKWKLWTGGVFTNPSGNGNSEGMWG